MNNSQPFIIYNASAGSGKTYTLVKEYLKIVFRSNNQFLFKNILAITFTNKAVAEMKERIISTLKQFADKSILQQPNNMFEDLCKELEITPENLHKKSEALLHIILHNYASFDISTIDGFTHKIIRTFAHDLKLPLNFEVELDQDTLLNEAVDSLINRAGTDTELTKILVEFAIEKADEDKSWDIAFDLNKIAKLLVNENEVPFIKLLENKTLNDFNLLKLQLKTDIKITEKNIVAISNSVLNLIEENNIALTDFSGSYLPNYFKKISEKIFDVNFNAKWQDNIENSTLYPKRVSNQIATSIEAIQPKIAIAFNETKDAIYHYKLIKSIYKNITPLSVLSAINNELSQLKQEQNKMLISEFNAIINKEIKNQPAPFIYERIGEKFNHYFIDEFQDTSVNQWQNLTPLLENTLAKENGSLMIVGDAKQAIYRWRGGKAEQFMDLFNKKNAPFPIQQDIKNLAENYRSFKEIVNFNNGFFRHLSDVMFINDDYKTLYKNVEQKLTKTEDGYVELSFLNISKTDDDETDYDNIYPAHVLSTVNRCLKNGYNLKDICVLVRKNKQGVAVADYLSQNQIPIISSETLLLSNAIEVNFTNNLLSLMVQPKNQEFKIAVLNDLATFFNIEDKHTFFTNHINLSISKLFESFETYHIYINSNVLQQPLYDIVETILRSFNLLKTSNAYLQFYLDVVLEFSQKKGSDIAEFLAYFNKKKNNLSIVSPVGQNAVQIMTVHKSKGLQFPVVIFPYADLDIYKEVEPKEWYPLHEKEYQGFSHALLNYNKDFEHYGKTGEKIYNRHQSELELDNINLLYVTLTRAVEQLYVISKNIDTTKKDPDLKNYSSLLIHYLIHLGLWNNQQSVYSFGNPEKETPQLLSAEQTKTQHEFISTPRETHNIKIVTKSGLLWDTSQKEALEKGNLIHNIMSQITTKTDVDEVINTFTINAIINKEQAISLKKIVLQIVNHPILENHYNSKNTVYNERDIISKKGIVLRPDRIIINKNNEAVIIDYKTGAVDRKHAQQIQLYQDTLEDMNFIVKEKILVYINDDIEVKPILI